MECNYVSVQSQTIANSSANAARPAAHGVVYLSFVPFLALLGGYALHIFAARWLPTADYGRFVLVLSILLWTKNLQSQIFSGGLAKSVSEEHGRLRAALAVAKRWYFPSAIAVFVLLACAAPLIAAGDRILLGLLLLGALEIPFSAVFRLSASLNNAMRRYPAVSFLHSVYALLRPFIGCLLLALGFGAFGAIGGQVIAGGIAGAVGLFLLVRTVKSLPAVDYPNMLHRSLSWTVYALPFSVIMSTMLAMDLWFVKGLTGSAEIAGIYGVAFTVARTPNFIALAVTGAVFPRVSQAIAAGDFTLSGSVSKEAFRVLIIVFVPLCVLIGESATAITTFMFSDRYNAAGLPLSILIVAISVFAFFRLLLVLIAASDRPGVRLLSATVILPIGVGLNILLIPRFGIVGAACATLITMAAGSLALTPFVRRFTAATMPMGTFARCGLAGSIIFVCAFFWQAEGWLLIPKLSVFTGIYVIILFLLGELGKEELRSTTAAFPAVIRTRLDRWI